MQLVIFNDIEKNALKGLGSPILLQSPYPKPQSSQVPSGPSQVVCPILSLCFSLLENFLMRIFPATIALTSGWMFKAAFLSMIWSPEGRVVLPPWVKGGRGDQGSGFSSPWGGEGRPLGGFQVLSCLGTHNCHRKHVFLAGVNRPTHSVESSFDSLLSLLTVLRKSNRQETGPGQRSSDLRGLYSRWFLKSRRPRPLPRVPSVFLLQWGCIIFEDIVD